MDSFTKDLWAMVLARLPIKIFTWFKLVCKQWKSIVESPFFRDLFISVHQSSPSSSWSLMCSDFITPELVGHYQCDTWGLKRSLGSFIESFLADKKPKRKYLQVSRVKAYSNVGLILIHAKSTVGEKRSLYVANPVSRECVEIILDALPIAFEMNDCQEWGLVTRAENGHLLGYKAVIFEKPKWGHKRLSCLIYSSETGLWSLLTLHLPDSVLHRYSGHPISLNGKLHWLGLNKDHHEVVLSMDFYDTSSGSVRCRVTPFPDLEKTSKFTRFCTPCQGFLMYMNIVDGSKLCLWRLQSEGYWELISEISPGFTLTGLDYLPLTINPLDAKTAYFWSTRQEGLLSINLHNGKFVIHRLCEGRSDRPIIIPGNDPKAMISFNSRIEMAYIIRRKHFIPFVLPQWLHRIPTNTVRIKEPTTTAPLR